MVKSIEAAEFEQAKNWLVEQKMVFVEGKWRYHNGRTISADGLPAILAAFAASIQEGDRQQIEELTIERDYAKANWERVGKKYKAAEQQLAEARAQGWISVKNRLPELGEWCLVVIGGITQRVASKRRQLDGELIGWEWFDSDADCAPADAVTHWQPIPEFAEPRAGRNLEGTK